MGDVRESVSHRLALRVGIVGAGIAGLAAAASLARAGHEVEVSLFSPVCHLVFSNNWQIFEKSEFSSEVGAAINVCPNAGRILSRWGFDFERWQPCVAQEVFVDHVQASMRVY